MGIRKIELDVDVIGGQSSLTFAEEKALSDFFKRKKVSASSSKSKNTRRPAKALKVRS